ncbi:MAG: hypothetical protein HYZ57_15115, partial [Acidobacteria bacterium]|nr:hypothetical protein [Acidobacteriota bacterium]
MRVTDVSGNDTGWQDKGDWNVTGNHPPALLFMNPVVGSGVGPQRLQFVYFNPNGAAAIGMVLQTISGVEPTTVQSCTTFYDPSTNDLYLANDAGNDFAAIVKLGTAGQPIQNGQCSIDQASSSASTTAGTLTLNLQTTFRTGFVGTMGVWTLISDSVTGMDSGTPLSGIWELAGNIAPTITTDPAANTGTGMTKTFVIRAADANGAGSLYEMLIFFSDGTTTGCALLYWVGPGTVTPIETNGEWLTP